jgi:hypothetical protein
LYLSSLTSPHHHQFLIDKTALLNRFFYLQIFILKVIYPIF